MKTGSEPSRLLKWTGRGIRYVVLLATVCLLVMFGSFLLFRELAHLVRPSITAKEEAIAAAARWQAFARELVDLTSEYSGAVAGIAPAESEAVRARLSETLLPRVNDLRRRLAALPEPDQTDMALLRAADELALAVRQPENLQLRLETIEDVLGAVQDVDTRIDVLGVRKQAGPVVDVRALKKGGS